MPVVFITPDKMNINQLSKFSQDWLLASMVTAVAWGIAVIIILTADGLIGGEAAVVASWLALLGGGLVVGIGQWLFLQPAVRRGLDWLLVSAFGWAIAIFLMLQLITFTSLIPVQIFIATLLGLVLGLGQQAVTHDTGIRSRSWVFNSASLWGLTWFITAVTLTDATTITTTTEMATIWLAGWGVLSVLTTLFLVLLFPEKFGESAQQFRDEWLTRPQKSAQEEETIET
jgi:hypothetical protein